MNNKKLTGDQIDWMHVKMVWAIYFFWVIVTTFFGALAYGLESIGLRLALWALLGQLMLLWMMWTYKPYCSCRESDRAAEACGYACVIMTVTAMMVLTLTVNVIVIWRLFNGL